MIPVVAKTNARWQLNPDYSAGMFSSIRCGIRAIPASCAAFFLLPVDIPLVAPATLMHLRNVFQRSPAVRICYPSYRDRRGHPPLIDRQLVQELLDYEGTEGMRGFLRNYEDQSLVIPVADRFIAMDADTPHDFQQLQEACRPEE